MNAFVMIFGAASALAMATLPRRWAPVPLLACTCYMTISSAAEIGPFSFPVLRVLIAVGVTRVLLRGEARQVRANGLDWLVGTWAGWALMSALFHEDVASVFVHRLGLAFNACGAYFLFRVFIVSLNDLLRTAGVIAMLLTPVAIEMSNETMTGRNLFASLGGVSESPERRGDRVRAQGAFAHPILAGTVGAVSLPLMIGLWPGRKKTAAVGIVACSAIVVASASSGPILSAAVALGSLLLWRWRRWTRVLRWTAPLGYLGLELIMRAPAYYLLARLDVIGGSTGWHRAALIDNAIQHLPEWWIVGTDATRHWMPYGVAWSGSHADITNYYLNMGVWGGLPLMLLFIATLARAFSFVGRSVLSVTGTATDSRFMIWGLGASLGSHAVTFLSVSYFDQSVVLLYLALGAIGSVWAGAEARAVARSSAAVAGRSAALVTLHGRKQSTELRPRVFVRGVPTSVSAVSAPGRYPSPPSSIRPPRSPPAGALGSGTPASAASASRRIPRAT